MRWGIAVLLVATGAGCDQVFTVDVPSGACAPAFGTDAYVYVSTAETWLAAELRCEALDLELGDAAHTHLAVLSDELELNKVRYPDGFVEAWIGITDRVVRDEWLWVTDEAIPSIVWGSGEPDDPDADRCGRVDAGDFMIHDTGCAAAMPYVCECDGFAVDTTHLE
jgi:hypothetical protein